jgi:ABC-type Fe3+/spermidine/putrescine transport system ATPase subunit
LRLAAESLRVDAVAPDNWHVHAGKPVTFTIRPERIAIAPAGTGEARAVGTVRSAVYQGAFTTYELDLDAGPPLTLRHAGPASVQPVGVGQRAAVNWRDEDVLVLRDEPRSAFLPLPALEQRS